MSVTSTKGLKIWMEKAGVTPKSVVPTAISKAKPTVITADTAGLADTEICEVTGTDYPEIDDKIFVLDGITTGGGAGTATGFNLVGSDTTGSAGTTIGTGAAVKVFSVGDMVNVCLSSIDISQGTPNSIDISTWCSPGASLPGNPTAGTITLNGYTDIAHEGYQELLYAEADGKPRMIMFQIPSQGYLVGKITIGSIAWTIPIEGSTSYAASATMSVPMKHVFS